VLAHDQQEVCVRFARSGGDKFTGIPWWTSPNVHPVLLGSVTWIDCRLEETRQISDHVLAVGRGRPGRSETSCTTGVLARAASADPQRWLAQQPGGRTTIRL
jgi:flavin reductase (DIM6/NTAB) family NADH-FMN oxidoreductase RutF